jgi:hypothetical protein
MRSMGSRRRRGLSLAGAMVVVLAAVAVIIAIAGSSGGSTQRKPHTNATQGTTGQATEVPAEKPRFFAPTSFWNEPLPDDAPLDPSSQRLVAQLLRDIADQKRLRYGPWIQTTDYSVPIFTVGANQPARRVDLAVTAPYGTTLRGAFMRVPLPANARPAPGTDGHLVVWQPSSDRMWEFWQLRRQSGGWLAGWGGAMEHVSRNPGVYDTTAWPGARPYWGASATSLPMVGGLIGIDELRRGRIDHALAISIPDPRANCFSKPAQRTDGSNTSNDALPEGARLRLDPKLNIDALDLPPAAATIARAAQRYGIVLRDRTARALTFYGEDPRGAPDPYPQLFSNLAPNELLANFPWDHLQVMKMDVRCLPKGGQQG